MSFYLDLFVVGVFIFIVDVILLTHISENEEGTSCVQEAVDLYCDKLGGNVHPCQLSVRVRETRSSL